MKRLFEIGSAFGVAVYVHWSALAISVLLVIGAIRRPALALSVLFSFVGVMLIHEIGHTVVAQHYRYEVFSIELYPIHGLTRLEQPESRYDESLIAWGGFVAQMIVAIPLIRWVLLFGFTSHDSVNAIFAILGYYSAIVAVVNLLPIPPFDGSKAWSLIPLTIQKWHSRAQSRRPQAKPASRLRVMR